MPDNKAEQRREEAEARADEYHSTSETARPLVNELEENDIKNWVLHTENP